MSDLAKYYLHKHGKAEALRILRYCRYCARIHGGTNTVKMLGGVITEIRETT
jgi:hypothetical protein